MTVLRSLAELTNRAMKPLGLRLERVHDSEPWDEIFDRWISEARARGKDPNDIGDEEWGADLLDEGLARHYLPFVDSEATILELGPGSGRLTRHLVGKAANVIVADVSKSVCAWMNDYLAGKGTFEVQQLTGAAFPLVASESIDCVFAHGVFEHLDFDECYWFFAEFFRVLRPGGVVAFNYDSLLSDDAVDLFRSFGSPTKRSVFRLHHPAAIERIAALVGFHHVENFSTGTRIAFARLEKSGERSR